MLRPGRVRPASAHADPATVPPNVLVLHTFHQVRPNIHQPIPNPSGATQHMPSTTTSPQVAVNDIGSAEDFLAAIDATIKYFNDGDIVEGTIVKVDRDEVLLDIGYKTEGVIPSRELSIKHDVDPNEVVSVGDEIEALVLTKEDKEGRLILSKKRAQYERAWGTIEELKEKDEAVKGTVIEVVKGGLILDIGLRGFLPASLVEMRRVRDLQPYVGKEIEAKIIELDKNRNNVVLSRRAWLEQTQSEVRSEFLHQLQKGQVRKGVVSSIVNFGAFVDLGGVDGLVHVSELSWKHIDHPSEVVEVGTEVTVEVLDVDLDRERVSLSLKATQEDPWRQFARTHAIGQIVPGKVTKLVPFGAFVRVEEGIEGLVHISELAERHVEVPDQVVGVGDDALVKVIDIDLERRRISLSLKQANEDYAEEFDPSKYGMADSYDEGGNYIFPEGFDSETNEWLEGYEKQREEWEGRYAEAERRHKMHTAQMEKTAKDEAAEAANTNYSSESGQAPADAEGDAPAASAPASTGGSLASDAQLAALREKLSGNA
ncbi:SSU ribosomal protein S1p [Rhodococcus sp. B7740]|nr:SSU ribosomal protein S1p [Rhodococcus sp. B7740]